ncbi:MAG: hypothetical protein ABI378_14185 [Chitinophagaceae bacterium]
MIQLAIPGYKETEIHLEYLLLDFNGTLAIDGRLMGQVKEKLIKISEKLQIHILTANTFGTASEELIDIPCKLVLLPEKNQCFEKGKYTRELSKDSIISIGNGRNDKEMFQNSAIRIIVIQTEGAAIDTLNSADIVCSNILDALDLIDNPLRLTATLRS